MDARQLIGGAPITEGFDAINPATGMQRDYVVLSPEERARGFVQPVRERYMHKVLGCGAVTTMHREIAETYARDPAFYSGTFCSRCRSHFPLSQFVWDGTNLVVGKVHELEPPKPGLSPHQRRVVEEKAELDGRLDKLRAFTGGSLFRSLPDAEQNRMLRQEHAMDEYAKVLGERIEAFPT